MTVRRGATLVCLAAMALAVFLFVVALRFPLGEMAQPGPGAYSLVIGVLMFVAAAGALLELRTEASLEVADLPPPRARWRLAALLAVILAYILACGLVGHFVAATVLMMVVLMLMEPSRPWRNIILALFLAGGSYYLFVVLLDVQLPSAAFE